MNKDVRMIAAFLLAAGMIYFYFENQKNEKVIGPIRQSVIANHRPLIMHFYANWCGPCKAYDPILKSTLRPYEDTIECKDLNIDIAENRNLLHNFGVTAIPTTVIFDRKGNIVAKEVGCLRSDELDKFIRKAVAYK